MMSKETVNLNQEKVKQKNPKKKLNKRNLRKSMGA